MEEMCRPYWGAYVKAWPVGIDTERWLPFPPEEKIYDVLVYDKIRWERGYYAETLVAPIRAVLLKGGYTIREIRYGNYREEEFLKALRECRAMIFLCEHETQGIAYQQALSSGVPVFAWDRQGYWQDPAYYPHKVKFEPVTSVPYFDERCGSQFNDPHAFQKNWDAFWEGVKRLAFQPRDYILENLTLEKCARRYLSIAREVS
jgi:glycosyltransferase involved in cell wall biosynthesis